MESDPKLEDKLVLIREEYFPDLPFKNKVVIRWGKKWRSTLGQISQIDSKDVSKGTLIEINAIFRDEEVPNYLIDSTIAHELIHYLHGFFSPLEKKFEHPHANGVMLNEMKRRGFHLDTKLSRKWLKQNWDRLYKKHCPTKKKKTGKRKKDLQSIIKSILN